METSILMSSSVIQHGDSVAMAHFIPWVSFGDIVTYVDASHFASGYWQYYAPYSVKKQPAYPL